MAALTARLPDSESRRILIHNLAEEHGLEEERAFDAAMAHDRTFIKFLGTLGVEPNEIAASVEEPTVRAFNLALLGACTSESPAFAFSCLGMIEYMFADISALIGTAVVRRGWIAAGDLVHYKLHAEIDKRHAAEFFGSAENREADSILAGIEFGHHIFDGLYRSLISSP
jgi:pyrroloquinoline-quinone synthase